MRGTPFARLRSGADSETNPPPDHGDEFFPTLIPIPISA